MRIFARRKLERGVRLTHNGLEFTFRVDPEGPNGFWRVESAGRIYRSPLEVSGREEAGFFRALGDAALSGWD